MLNLKQRNASIESLVWVVLTSATFVSWLLGHGDGPTVTGAVSAVIVGVAVAKAYLVGNYFMEVREGPTALRWAFRVYLMTVGSAFIGILLVA